MKIILSIELDIPDDTEAANFSHEEIGQLLSDSYVQYTTNQHLKDALKWCVKAKIGSESEDIAGKQIYSYHNTWADICHAAKWDYKILDNNA